LGTLEAAFEEMIGVD